MTASDIASPKEPYPDGVEAMPLDVTKEQNWATAVATITRRHGRLDVLIDNAGIIAYEPLDAFELEAWMRKSNSGSIVDVSSIWGSAAVSVTGAELAIDSGYLAQ